MPHKIPEHHIERLTKGPSDPKIKEVAALQNYIQELLSYEHHTFLQGSYRNDTAVADINDVDIVALRKTTYSSVHSPYTFSTSIAWDDIFSQIEAKLKAQTKYQWTVTRGDKCIKIEGDFDVDVIPAVKIDPDHTTDPISVYSTKSGIEKQNFPRLIYENGVAKNAQTVGAYKPTVRMFKNWALNHINDDKTISSFKIQALVYGVTKEKFHFDDPAATFIIVGHEILKALQPIGQFQPPVWSVCGSEDINVGWDPALRAQFVEKLNVSLDHALSAYSAQHPTLAEANWKIAFNL